MIIVADYLHQLARAKGLAADDAAGLERAVAAECGMDWVDLGSRTIPAEVLSALPRSLVAEHSVMPFALEGGVLHVAVADPLAVDVLDSLAHVAATPVRAALAPAADIREAVTRHYGRAPAAPDPVPPANRSEPTDDAIVTADDAPVIRLVQEILAEAVRRRASDIHFEPLARRFRVRYRIDGVLHEVDGPPRQLQPAILSRLKIMANISIAEKRVPQDGRIRLPLAGRSLDLRVSSLPTAHGESLVLRILDQSALAPGLAELGLLPDDRREFERLIALPDGMVLVTGPTGSGKTTSLYASLHLLNRPDRKIITVEDPVEYQLSGVNQVPVNPGTGLTFAAALRALLRQAPDVVMVGEIRDGETAEIAIHAALTGHLVFSTLHTNDAPSAVTRLIDLGAKPFLVAAALRAVTAQRLVRRICPQCKRAHTPSVRERHALGLTVGQLATGTFAHGAGCAACHGTGYHGRMGLYEILPFTDGIRALIYDNVTASRLRRQARQDGLRTLREDGIRKVLAGLTTIEEVASVTVGDTFNPLTA